MYEENMNITNSKYAYVAAQWKYGQSDVFMMKSEKDEEPDYFNQRIARSIDPTIHNNTIKHIWLKKEVKRTREYCKIHDAGGILYSMLLFSFEDGMT